MPTEYQKEEAKVQNAIRAWESNYYTSIIAAAAACDAKIWRVRRRLQGRQSKINRLGGGRLL